MAQLKNPYRIMLVSFASDFYGSYALLAFIKGFSLNIFPAEDFASFEGTRWRKAGEKEHDIPSSFSGM